jgi:signal transduction histidine kinase
MPQNPPDYSQDLTRANEEIYKQNFELSIRNKTLSVLRALYAISISSFDITEIAQKIVDTLVTELQLSASLIFIVDSWAGLLRPLAISQSPAVLESLSLLGKPLPELTINLNFPDNLIINAIKSQSRQITSNLLDILTPLATQEISDQIENLTQIKTLVIYPLLLGDKTIGALTLGLPKKVDDLSRAEKETLEEAINLVTIALDRAELHADLEQANTKLQDLDKLKDEFISVTSHELRAPMTAIKSYTWLVINDKAGPLDPKARDYLNKVYQSTERLIHLVSEMLDVSRIESGRVQLHPETFDMRQLATDVKEEFSARATEVQLTLNIQGLDNPLQITADQEKIHQVLENLVSNAIKFTPAGGHITISLAQKENSLETSVTDTGLGISEEDQKRLFIKFGRLENSLIARAGTGSGLGLFICKQYVELHQGQIWFTSQLGQGSTFTFSLPLN